MSARHGGRGSCTARSPARAGTAGAQRQLEEEYNKRVAAVVDDCAEWVHAGVMRRATLRASVEFGSPCNGCLL